MTLNAAVDSLMATLESMSYDKDTMAIILCGITASGGNAKFVQHVAVRSNVPLLAILHAVVRCAQEDDSMPEGIQDVCRALGVMIEHELGKAVTDG